MWTIRLILLAGLTAMTSLDFYMLRNRHKRKGLIENWAFNSLLVVAYFSCSCLVAALPPAGGWDQRPVGWLPPGVRVSFVVAGSALLCLGLTLSLVSLRQRRALGLQDSRAGLLTSGVYRHFRHPIYAGILWTCLGLSLVTRNPDGLLMFPALLAIFIVQALIEEKYDVSVRFRDPYREYRLGTRMFGPAWLWSLLLVAILLLALHPAWTGRFGLAGLSSRSAVQRIRTDGVTSYYVYSGPDASHEGKLPTIIFIGHPLSSPFKDLAVFKTWFDETMQRDLAGETRTGRIIESCNSDSRFILKPGEGHGAMGKYWRENLQYVLQFRRKDIRKMISSREHTAASHREAFLSWARRAAVPLPASPEEPLDERTQAALDRMLAGKRFAFLGEPDHFIIEKYPFRLLLIQYLLERGWRHIGMETGRSVGWRVDRYLETGDASDLSTEGAESPNPMDQAIHDKILEFVDAHEYPSFPEQLRQISERRVPGTARLHYWGYDLDAGIPLGSVKPIQRLLEGHASSQVHELPTALDKLKGLSTDEQLVQIEALQSKLPRCADVLPEGTFGELQSWLAFLHESVAAEKRPRANRDPGGFRRWWAQREHFLMQSLDAIVDGLSGDEKLILLGHNVHLSKDAANLQFHPQFRTFWGFRSWLRAWGYRMFFKLAGWPTNMGDSVGAHLHRRFPGQVLSIWMLYGQGSLMTSKGPRTVRLRDDTVQSLLARVGDRFLLPLNDVDPQARAILSHANVRLMEGHYASTDLTAQADALYFVKDVKAE